MATKKPPKRTRRIKVTIPWHRNIHLQILKIVMHSLSILSGLLQKAVHTLGKLDQHTHHGACSLCGRRVKQDD